MPNLELILERLEKHIPTHVRIPDSIFPDRGACSCGLAIADGVTPYAKIWINHMRKVLSMPPALLLELRGIMSRKVNLVALRHACQHMIYLIDEINNPKTDSSGARNFGFPQLANRIRLELDGSVLEPTAPVESLEANAGVPFGGDR